MKLTELAEMVKLTGLIGDNGLDKFIRDWEPFVEFLWGTYIKYNNGLLTEGFEI